MGCLAGRGEGPRQLAALTLCMLCLGACGGPTLPTAPAAPPAQIGGIWAGDFTLPGSGFGSKMNLDQTGASVRGSLFLSPGLFDSIEGTVSATTFTFKVVPGTACRDAHGELTLTIAGGVVTAMTGPTTIDFSSCLSAANPTDGTLRLRR
ncbi:MAG TPA: hypothetical protein VHR45_09590 [Thermoanaerobaculia bacterium]|nr:hypothetical protein [Thermoanaerobaculia bacterium]